MKLLVCCKASTEIGLGHLIRSAAFARQVFRAYPEVHIDFWLFGDPNLLPLAEAPGLCTRCFPLDSKPDNIPDVDILILDLIDLEHGVMDLLQQKTRITALLSPITSHFDRADIFFSRTRHLPQDLASHSKLTAYAGLEYTIIQENCRKIDAGTYENHLFNNSFSIAISMGGGDAANKSLWVLNRLRKCSVPATFWVMLGEGYKHSFDRLIEEIKGHTQHEIILAKTNKSMWQILKNCVLAILPGGITTYEAVYAGLPTMNLFDSPTQEFLLKELEEQGAIMNMGLFSDENLHRVADRVEDLFNNRKQLLQMHVNSKLLIDDQGAKRIFDTIASHL